MYDYTRAAVLDAEGRESRVTPKTTGNGLLILSRLVKQYYTRGIETGTYVPVLFRFSGVGQEASPTLHLFYSL